MINKNKKATTMYEFLVRLVIAVVFVLFAISLAKSLFSFSNEAEDSFYNLISLIEEVSQGKEGLTDSMALVMDKKTSILLFNKDSDYIKYIAVEENFLNKFFGHKGKAELIEKPKNCPEDKSCICLCQGKFEKAAEGYHEIMPILGEGEYTSVTYYYCKKTNVCEGIDQDILVWPQIEQIESIS